uniref:Beta-defensin n=1 Tax=Canis lupus familiaris TaxID=9615 RepID=A0A8C0TF70_CANLF
MKLILIIAILLFQKSKVTEQLKRCWGEYIRGYCRKICRISEIREVLCENGRYCCLNSLKKKKKKKAPKSALPQPYPSQKIMYVGLKFVTLLDIQL